MKRLPCKPETVTVRDVWIRKGGEVYHLRGIGKLDLEIVGQWPEAEAPVVFAPTLDRFECERREFA